MNQIAELKSIHSESSKLPKIVKISIIKKVSDKKKNITVKIVKIVKIRIVNKLHYFIANKHKAHEYNAYSEKQSQKSNGDVYAAKYSYKSYIDTSINSKQNQVNVIINLICKSKSLEISFFTSIYSRFQIGITVQA